MVFCKCGNGSSHVIRQFVKTPVREQLFENQADLFANSVWKKKNANHLGYLHVSALCLRRIWIPEPSVNKIVPAVLNALLFFSPDPTYIDFPHKYRWQATIKQGFCGIAGFTNACGAMNCTHMAIKAPSNKKWMQLCRQKGISIFLTCRHFTTQICLCCWPVARWEARLVCFSWYLKKKHGYFNIFSYWKVMEGYMLKQWLPQQPNSNAVPMDDHWPPSGHVILLCCLI